MKRSRSGKSMWHGPVDPRAGRRQRRRAAESTLAPGGKEATDRFAYRHRDLRGQRLARYFRRLAVRLEEIHAVRTLRQVSTETGLFFLRQLALEVVETELDELVTVDHGVPSLKWPSCRLPAFPACSMAAPGGGFAESYANVGRPGNTCKETRSAVQPMRSHAGQRFVARR